jgi:uncharacterized membrane protein (DUF485 family)
MFCLDPNSVTMVAIGSAIAGATATVVLSYIYLANANK